MKKDDDTPFSYLVKVGHISANPVEVTISADAGERAGLAELWSVLEVKALSATFQVMRWKRDGVRLKGRVAADIVQACVVTLEPVESHIDEPVEVVFVPEGSKLARLPVATDNGEMLLDPDGPDAPEIFAGDSIDAGEVAAEHVALAIDPYPRKPDAAFSGHVESTDKDDRKPSPFAVLKDWKKD
ncbi:YceD family protein [Shinella sp. BYT-45]|uniref:YceD family protein n=1 Tax=Shinella sp. BYT-45 TaxID=3377377 RepID=UPI00397EDA19